MVDFDIISSFYDNFTGLRLWKGYLHYLLISWKLRVAKYWQLCWWVVSTACTSWFTGDFQLRISTLFSCVFKPLYEQFFDWNCCVDIDSKGKIWDHFKTAYFPGKMKIYNHFRPEIYPFLGKHWKFWDLFQSPGKNTCAFK